MNSGSDAQAVMLLTVSFGRSDRSKAKPLSPKEWARFAAWLGSRKLEVSALLKGELRSQLHGWLDRSITLCRLERLLDRGGALGLALEKWQRAGLWIMTQSDPEYPERLRHRLRLETPPVLFGCGNEKLLARGGIAVVGSRDADPKDIGFAGNLGDAAARQGYSIVSGGARGVDQSAMLSALKNEGTAIGVVAESLLRAATSAKYRKFLLSRDLALVTPFNPEAGFNVGNAMSRNRYIYCLADAAIVVSSTPNRGGTWNGALEDLKAAWIPLWVKRTESEKSGNASLVQRGAKWIPDDLESLEDLMCGATSGSAKASRLELPLKTADVEPPVVREASMKVSDTPDSIADSHGRQGRTIDTDEPAVGSVKDRIDVDFYTLFLIRMLEITANGPMKTDDIALRLELEKSQVASWLKRGVGDGNIRKMSRPVRFQATERVREQRSLFGEFI